ncbi:hypothetical protein AC578_7380 [Pseudocercospora eumusae]|uniref:Autophagy-related protein 16 domain-containing protein n=1 Tax=Pseudocercospora eumusae TaxID=321146 RepID=A0A139H509_9PEZI|nr:hypothetical protein AC578_7380 [Pseudocercospora eumusae]
MTDWIEQYTSALAARDAREQAHKPYIDAYTRLADRPRISALERKLRDREDELAGKSKLLEKAQDEMVSLQLQLNVVERRREEVEVENRGLVRRWVERMGVEVERVNRGSGW